MTREERDEMIWLYAAGALSEAEMQTVRALLEEGDAEDLSSLAAARETLARLPESLDGTEPSEDVLDRLMKRVDPAAASTATAPRRSRYWIIPLLVSAAAACVAVVSILSAQRATRDADQMRSQLDQALATLESGRAQAAREVADLKSQLEAQKVASAKQMDALIAQSRLLFTPELSFTSFERKDLPRGGGRVVWDQANRKSHVFVFDLAPLPEGKVYELWLIEPDKAPVPGGTFTVDAQGNAQIVASIPETLNNVQVAAITVEPAGGSPAPTSEPILVGVRTQ